MTAIINEGCEAKEVSLFEAFITQNLADHPTLLSALKGQLPYLGRYDFLKISATQVIHPQSITVRTKALVWGGILPGDHPYVTLPSRKSKLVTCDLTFGIGVIQQENQQEYISLLLIQLAQCKGKTVEIGIFPVSPETLCEYLPLSMSQVYERLWELMKHAVQSAEEEYKALYAFGNNLHALANVR